MSNDEQLFHANLHYLGAWYSPYTQAEPNMDPSECSNAVHSGTNEETNGQY